MNRFVTTQMKQRGRAVAPGSALLSGTRIRCGVPSVSRQRKPAVRITRLLNHLIRLDHHVLWYHEAKLVRGFQIDENFKFFRQPDLQITGFCALQDLYNIPGGPSE